MTKNRANGPDLAPPRLGDQPDGAAVATPSHPHLGPDRALRDCVLAFGMPGPAGSDASPWSRLVPEWRDRMGDGGAIAGPDPGAAFERLRSSHQSQARVDRGRVHPSWWARAGQDESPAVQSLLAGTNPDRPADPMIAGWVRALAGERLVGGEPPSPEDPPAIVAIAGLSPRTAFRLADAIGHAKDALAAPPDEEAIGRHGERHRWFRERLVPRLGGDEDRLRQWARREVERPAPRGMSPRRARALHGLTTLARLLTACEPFRVRWALQHLPYPVAKRFRGVMSAPGQAHPQLVRLEEAILRTARERLALEGRIDVPDPAEPARPSDAH